MISKQYQVLTNQEIASVASLPRNDRGKTTPMTEKEKLLPHDRIMY
jgi:hypothetical protein